MDQSFDKQSAYISQAEGKRVGMITDLKHKKVELTERYKTNPVGRESKKKSVDRMVPQRLLKPLIMIDDSDTD